MTFRLQIFYQSTKNAWKIMTIVTLNMQYIVRSLWYSVVKNKLFNRIHKRIECNIKRETFQFVDWQSNNKICYMSNQLYEIQERTFFFFFTSCTWLARLKFCSASVPASHGHYVNEVGCFRRKFVEDFYIIMFCKPSVGRIKTASNSGAFLSKSENVLGLGTL